MRTALAAAVAAVLAAIVWIIATASTHQHRVTLSLDPDGNIIKS
jgi:hypothetical protein